MSVVIEARGVKKVYLSGGSPLEVLSDVNLAVHPGEVVAVVGASGTGKSTLLHLLGALDQPSAGEISVDGESYSTLSAA
ncbi:MAG: ATP-binding cassette domain-containing protein, partial [Deltaproteobacteria bacterium]|nr:ATP-binding cassette domain-containing protein [Deltaproteobacteria bacterium]